MTVALRILSHCARAVPPLGLVLWLVAAVVPARAAVPAAAPAAASHSHGLLWKIDGKGYPPSYVFGTIHLADPRVTHLPPPVRAAFDASNRLVVEVALDAAGVARFMQAMRFADGPGLKRAVGARLYAAARAALRKRGTPLRDLDRYKPWAVVLMLSVPPSAGGVPLDLALEQRATQRGRPVEGLETVAEQVAVFDGLTPADQRELLETTLRQQAGMPARLEALTRAYLARDLAELRRIAVEDEPADPALARTLTRRLLDERNRRMVARMQSWLRRGGAFIAVGAAHLPGPNGILQRLRRRGYNLSAVY